MMAAAGNTFFFPWEVSLMEWLQASIGGTGISILSFFSTFGEELMLILIVGFVYWSYDKKLGRTMGMSAIMGLTWNTMFKNIALRRRPYFDHEGIRILRVVEPNADIYDIAAQGYSFPGAHYPTDVLAGWLLGLISVMIVQLLQKRVKNTFVRYGILLICAVPGFFYCKTTDYFTGMGLLIGFMGGTLLDDHAVRFENTRKPLFMVTRLLGGLAVYLVVNILLKLPFSKEFLSDGSTAALMARCARYAIIAFVLFGIYPMLFRLENRTIEKGV